MWLTGFDAPFLHTMYADKPMRGHGLMQTIAQVNRVFRGKPGGLIVDYLGLGDQLMAALATYTEMAAKAPRPWIIPKRSPCLSMPPLGTLEGNQPLPL
jgi:type I site-specific restriction-modification system R (restriction) subunit